MRMKIFNRLILTACILGATGYAYWKLIIPTHRVEVRSELVMLGDLDGDHRWTKSDLKILDAFLHDPFSMTDSLACRIDMNQNGLIDEAIRIPYSWIRSIPREMLPGAVALDNFLLPGNKEDGADKSRHWNVFGGICLYKSPQEALDLALRREMKDLRDNSYSEEAMREFFRDMIANINGMYHVMTVKPGLLAGKKETAREVALQIRQALIQTATLVGRHD
jgi:hypothetical protein